MKKGCGAALAVALATASTLSLANDGFIAGVITQLILDFLELFK